MGYTTDFEGKFEFNRPLSDELKNYINTFCGTRRMQRDNDKIMEIYPDWEKYCFHGSLGDDGEYFARDDGWAGQGDDDSIVNYNMPPKSQPGLWCQWEVTDDGKYLQWNGGEKFYNYTQWLEYLIDNFFAPSGIVLNGSVDWQGEGHTDTGTIIVKNNNVSVMFS